MIDPGRLKTRLLIQSPSESADGQGGVVRGYTTLATVWAAVIPTAAREIVEAGAEGASVRVRIILRNHLSLTLRHRLADGTRVYRIVSMREIDDRRFVEIDAELRVE